MWSSSVLLDHPSIPHRHHYLEHKGVTQKLSQVLDRNGEQSPVQVREGREEGRRKKEASFTEDIKFGSHSWSVS